MTQVSQIYFDEEKARLMLNGRAIHCGDRLSVLIYDDRWGHGVWVHTHIDVTGEAEWYLVGLRDYSVEGLFAQFTHGL